MWPIIQRELRAEARRPMNRWLRVAGALAVMLACYIAGADNSRASSAQLGGKLFLAMHGATLVALWVFVPLLVADSIARERREGTLNLLFLTPMSTSAIIIGKSLTGLLRALCVWWAVVPIQVIPFLMGGITWLDVLSAVTLQFCTLLVALTAGLCASAASTRWNRALTLAYGLAIGLGLIGGTFMTMASLWMIVTYIPGFDPYQLQSLFMVPALLYAGAIETWGRIFAAVPGGMTTAWYGILAGFTLFCLFQLVTVIRGAGRFLQRLRIKQASDSTPSVWQRRFTATLFGGNLLRRRHRRLLNRNPIAWLQEHTWNARLTKWGWCLLVLGAQCFLMWRFAIDKELWWELFTWEFRLGMALLAGITFTAGMSFRVERETGALELILVSPVAPGELLLGRAWGIWRQFLPAALVWLGFYNLFIWQVQLDNQYYDWAANERNWSMLWMLMYFTAPLVGFYFSLRARWFFLGWALTWCFGIGMPLLFGWAGAGLVPDHHWLIHTRFIEVGNIIGGAIYLLSFIGTGLLAGYLLKHCLEHRLYSWR